MLKGLETAISGVVIIEPEYYFDQRGFFAETFNQREFTQLTGIDTQFVQDNHSQSTKGVLRGLHYQSRQPQGKLVRVAQGAVFDVAVDLRAQSQTYGKWVGEVLSQDNKKQMWIPQGFAHGFLVLTEVADFIYKTTDYYTPEFEHSLRWDDPDLAINWPLNEFGIEIPIVSAKDSQAKLLKELNTH